MLNMFCIGIFLKLRSVTVDHLIYIVILYVIKSVLYTLFHLCDTVKRSVFGSGEALY
jgi:hypothetical protein